MSTSRQSAATLTDASFDQTSWHDATIYGLRFQIGDPERDDWTSDLLLDLDFIVEWLRAGDGMPDGELRFGAVGFTQTLRAEPSLCDEQWLPRALRAEP